MTTMSIDGVSLRYHFVGPRDTPLPLVFLHGAAGGQYVWVDQAAGLKEDHGLVLLDLAGHGASGPGPQGLDVAGHARLVSQLLGELGVETYLPVGHSMGGAIALSLALQAPAQVAGLVLLATGARLPVSPMVFDVLERGTAALGELLVQVAYSPDTPPELVARHASGPIQATQEVVRADFEACQAFDLRDRLEEIRAPALLLGGEKDALVGQGRLRQLASGLPRCALQVIPSAGHMVMQEAPDAVNAAIRAFCLDLAATR